MALRCFSYGGGVQSTAALVLAVQGKIDYPIFLFSNVGHDSERPDTLTYVQDVAKPYAAAHGIELHELSRKLRDGSTETLMGRMHRSKRSLPIPVRMSNGAPARRSCTADFKIAVISKWQKQHGATKAEPAIVGLGISLDEIHRARTDSGIDWQVLDYPLISLRLTRNDCIRIIQDAGLSVPPKSSCYFCPFHSMGEWQRMRKEEPELFQKSVELERMLNDRRASLGKDQVWFTSRAAPLDQVVPQGQMTLDDALADLETCESGYCFV